MFRLTKTVKRTLSNEGMYYTLQLKQLVLIQCGVWTICVDNSLTVLNDIIELMTFHSVRGRPDDETKGPKSIVY